MKQTLSATLIVKNESHHLPNILRNLDIFADEIVIIDTGSTDTTVEVAKSFNAKVYNFKWCEDFAKARNYGISKCKWEFIIWLDADDIISDGEAKKINNLMKTPIDWDVCYLKYKVWNYLIKRERIFRNNGHIKFVSPIHECLDFEGYKFHIQDDIEIVHNKLYASENGNERNLRILLANITKKKFRNDSRMWANLWAEYRQKWELEKAIQAYTKASKIDPQNYKYYYHLWVIYKYLKDYDTALKYLWQSVEKNILIKEVYFEIWMIYYNFKKLDQALFIFLSSLNIENSDRIMIEVNKHDKEYIYDWLSLIYWEKKDYKNALKYVNLALKKNDWDERLKANKLYWEKQQ